MEKKEWLSVLKQRISHFMTRRNQCLIFLFTIVMAVAAIYAAIMDSFPQPICITLYVFAAAGLVCTCTLWVRAIIFFVKVVVLPFTKRNRIVNTLITDTRLRTVLATLPGMGMNLFYAIFNGAIGILNHSAWYSSLSAYYLLLCAMRFFCQYLMQERCTMEKLHGEKCIWVRITAGKMRIV